jgi:uncharacterized protein (DUF433 family)
VELILCKLLGGMSVETILADHPRLAFDDIRAAQVAAADNLPKKWWFPGESRDPLIRRSSS